MPHYYVRDGNSVIRSKYVASLTLKPLKLYYRLDPRITFICFPGKVRELCIAVKIFALKLLCNFKANILTAIESLRLCPGRYRWFQIMSYAWGAFSLWRYIVALKEFIYIMRIHGLDHIHKTARYSTSWPRCLLCLQICLVLTRATISYKTLKADTPIAGPCTRGKVDYHMYRVIAVLLPGFVISC